MELRIEQAADVEAVEAVIRAAFGDEGDTVAAIVADLRRSPSWRPGLSFVALEEGQVIGHVLLTGGHVDGPESSDDILVLSPLSVAPRWHGRGVGSALIAHALDAARQRTEPYVVLEGDPAYYRRFGFVPAARMRLGRPSRRIPADAFQAIALHERRPAGRVVYPQAFWDHGAVGLDPHTLAAVRPRLDPSALATADAPLRGTRIVSVAGNLPGPWAATRLASLGAEVTTIEPPGGDAVARFNPAWYEDLRRGHIVVQLDLRSSEGEEALDALLDDADVLLTSTRPSSLRRLGLGWDAIHARHPRLIHVGVVGDTASPERPGHDLTYQADAGIWRPPGMPRVPVADLAGAEQAVAAVLAGLLLRERTGQATTRFVGLADAARDAGGPARHRITTAGGVLGGTLATYSPYRCRDGWVIIATLEPHFRERALAALDLAEPGDEETLRVLLAERLGEQDCAWWEQWAITHDLPVTVMPDAPATGG